MSDRVHRTVRPTLPEGYQYGDARVFGALLHRRGPGNVILTSDGFDELIWKCFPPEWRRHTGAYADALRGINAVNSERADSWQYPFTVEDIHEWLMDPDQKYLRRQPADE